MIVLWILAVVGVAAGDVGLGYHYKMPQTSYGIPTYQTSSSSGVYNTGSTGSTNSNNYNGQYTASIGGGSDYYPGQGTNQYVHGSTVGYNTAYQTGYRPGFQTTGSAIGTGANSNYYQTSSSGVVRPTYQTGGDYTAFNQYQTSSQYQSSAADKYQQYYNVIQQQPAQVFKHYYVHAAPEEPEVTKPRLPIVLPPAQKHYKVIFIKAPAAPARAPQIIPVQPQNEEKTIVYVLVKKPEEGQDIVIPKIEQKPPSKPEVYFIKYNNKQDSQAVIDNIVTDLNKGGSDTGYAALSDAPEATSGINQGLASTTQIGQGSSHNQGSTVFDSSSYGSTAVGSGTIPNTVNTFDSSSTGSSDSSTFGSVLTGGGNYGSAFGSSNFGSIYDGAKGDNLNVASVGSELSQSGYDSSSDSSGYDSLSGSNVSSTASTVINYDVNGISTSQGVPHETYGPPKFKTL